MKTTAFSFCISLFLIIPYMCNAQDSISFKGQFSSWINYNGNSRLPLWVGGRYIPQLNYSLQLKDAKKVDIEASLNINGSAGIHLFDSLSTSAGLRAYRFWARYSTNQLEIRAGLQKINFGSASLMRPLMWFDQVDPRDPLKLTDGVWGILGRYYFLNNTNIWLWGLYGNNQPRGWEFSGTNSHYPELGGRIQVPVPAGEAAFSYNHRIAETESLTGIIPSFKKIDENRFGFDFKLDLVVGFWVESTWVNKKEDLGLLTNQEIINAGIDYTFNAGNGLYIVFEQLVTSFDEKPFGFRNSSSFSLLSVSYPVGLFDNVGGIVYYDWKNGKSYNFLNWQKQLNNLTLYLMGYWNPESYSIPVQGSGENLFAGKGLQIMLVLNH